MKKIKNLTIGSFLTVGLLISGCDTTETDNTEGQQVEGELIDSVKKEIEKPKGSTIGEFDGAIFSIPSPIQLSSIIQSSGAAYDANMMNTPDKVDKYSTMTSQALNLGIYGADLGYATLYDNNQASLKYMKCAKKLSDVLGISDAFDDETLTQIERTLGNKDSLLYLVSNTYRKADDYLQTSDRKQIGAMIIVGGWIESVFFASQLGIKQENPEIYKMVGMQKHTLTTMMDKMLVKYYNEQGVATLFDQLDDILKLYDNVNIKYEYVASEHDRDAKSTAIKSKSTVEISKETFAQITEKIAALRNQIIQ